MRILYVTAEVPWPLTSGYLRHYHFLRGLSERHRITQISLTRRAAVPADARDELERHVQRLTILAPPDARYGRLRRNLAVRRSAAQLRRVVAAELAAGTYDAVMLSGKDTFPALTAVGDTPLVVDVCDAASMRLAGELEVTTGLRRRALLRARLAEMRHIERRLVARTPHLLFASERDRDEVGARAGTVAANGVDLEYWTRRSPASTRACVAFSGAMAYRPNDDAARRLIGDLLPRLPNGTEVVLAGRDPLPALRAAAAASPTITVTGTVDDLRPHLERAAVFCAPLRFGAGIQNKLLEALAMELPVVTTTIAAAGLQLGADRAPLVVADDDAGLADAVAALLADPQRRAELAAAGRDYVVRHFSWDAAIERVEGALDRAAGLDAGAAAVPTLTRTQA